MINRFHLTTFVQRVPSGLLGTLLPPLGSNAGPPRTLSPGEQRGGQVGTSQNHANMPNQDQSRSNAPMLIADGRISLQQRRQWAHNVPNNLVIKCPSSGRFSSHTEGTIGVNTPQMMVELRGKHDNQVAGRINAAVIIINAYRKVEDTRKRREEAITGTVDAMDYRPVVAFRDWTVHCDKGSLDYSQVPPLVLEWRIVSAIS